MVFVRCTARLLARLGQPVAEGHATGALGDWYANVIATRPRVLILCINEHTLLSVVVPLAPAASFLDRAVAAVGHRIGQIDAPRERRQREIEALAPAWLARTTNRSVLSSLNHLAHDAQAWLAERPGGVVEADLEELGQWLCDTPCFPLTTTWPWQEALARLGGAR